MKADAKEFDAADRLFTKALAEDSTSAEAHYWLGYTDLTRQNAADALGHFQKAAILDPKNPRHPPQHGYRLHAAEAEPGSGP